VTARRDEAVADVARMIADMDHADAERLGAILEAEDGVTMAARIGDYYRDLDRADRTPRGLMYLHLGMLLGALLDAKGIRH
jgi:hypothetical protein